MTKHKTVNIVNEVNFKNEIDKRKGKYCRGRKNYPSLYDKAD